MSLCVIKTRLSDNGDLIVNVWISYIQYVWTPIAINIDNISQIAVWGLEKIL